MTLFQTITKNLRSFFNMDDTESNENHTFDAHIKKPETERLPGLHRISPETGLEERHSWRWIPQIEYSFNADEIAGWTKMNDQEFITKVLDREDITTLKNPSDRYIIFAELSRRSDTVPQLAIFLENSEFVLNTETIEQIRAILEDRV